MTTPKERQQEQRREKLRRMEEQIRKGSLVVRQMTPEEREESEARLAAARARAKSRPKPGRR